MIALRTLITAIITSACSNIASADSTAARCDIYPAGSDQATAMIACDFSQRQGFISISRIDGVVHELTPVRGVVGEFTDQRGREVYRQSGLGDQGLIFRLPDESVYVYWSTEGLGAQSPDSDASGSLSDVPQENPTAPFTTQDYDATAVLRCRAAGATDFEQCPAGISRMENGQASIVVVSPAGEQFTINFMTDYINATNREVEAQLLDDQWILSFGNGEVWQVPRAAIEGG